MNEQVIEKVADALSRAVRRQLVSPEAAGKVTKHLKLKTRTLGVMPLGEEAAVLLQTYPKKGLQITKVHNMDGLWYSKEMMRSKVKSYKALSRNPDIAAKFYGRSKRHPNVTHHEFVSTAGNSVEYDTPRLSSIKERFNITDLHPSNIVGGKIIDFLPASKKILRTAPIHVLTRKLRKVENLWSNYSNDTIAGTAKEQIKYTKKKSLVHAALKKAQSKRYESARANIGLSPKAKVDKILKRTFGS
jgi:hypothetical protein